MAELPPCLLHALFGSTDEGPTPTARLPPAISCVGCRLRSQLAEVDAFVEYHATLVPPKTLFRLAADLYETRVRPALGGAAGGVPEWPHEMIEAHYTGCALNVRLSIALKCRHYRAVRELLLKQLHRAAARGEDDPKAFALYKSAALRETSLHAQLWSLPTPPWPLRHATPPLPDRPSSVPPIDAASVVETASVDESSADDAASLATTSRAVYDAATVNDSLRDAIFSLVEPCVPTRRHAAQPTLAETLAGADVADVATRDRREQVQRFQEAAAPRRCFCSPGRRGGACHFRFDRAFYEQLVEAAPAVAFVYKDKEALRAAVQDTLQLQRGPLRTRKHYHSQTVFGYRPCKRPRLPALRSAAS